MNAATKKRAQAAAPGGATGEAFMKHLRDDHAGLSRVLREIDAQRTVLRSSPRTARPVLLEAMRYLLVYQHSVHHPREDQLFARIRKRKPMLYRSLKQLTREHRVDEARTEALARKLARTTPGQLRGKAGAQLEQDLCDYVRHAREHVRREETIFYSRSERVLRASDWSALTASRVARDPIGDPQRLTVRYPRLAARLAEPERVITGAGDWKPQPHDRPGIRQLAEVVAEHFGAMLHEAADLARRGVADLKQVRTPIGFARVSIEIGARGCAYAAKMALLPFRN